MTIPAPVNPDLLSWLRLAAANSSPGTSFANQARLPISPEPLGLLGLIQGPSGSGLLGSLSEPSVNPADEAFAPIAQPQGTNEDLAQRRYVSGLADRINGGPKALVTGRTAQRYPSGVGDSVDGGSQPSIFRDSNSGMRVQPLTDAMPVQFSPAIPFPGLPPLAFPPGAFDANQKNMERGIAGLLKYFRNGSDDSIPVDPDGPGCKEQWEEAYNICAKELSKRNPNRRVTGGHDNIDKCMPGWVDARCGGTIPEKPIGGSQKNGTAKYKDWRTK